MSLNTCNLETRLQQKIDGLTTSNDSIEFVVTGLSSCKNLKSFVANTSSLPNIYTDGIPNGTTIFVNSLGVHVIASENKWLGLDGRVLQNDATFGLWSWGNNNNGALGDGTTITRSSPVSVIGFINSWCQVSSGGCFTAAVRTNGTLWAWGVGTSGRLGDGTAVGKCSPVSVIGGFTDWCQVSAGYAHTAAVRQNGTLWSWGISNCGQLGDGTITAKSSPVSVIGGFTDWCQVSAGACHTAAVRQNGTLWGWGNAQYGRLGDGWAGSIGFLSPRSVLGGFTDWCQVSAGNRHTVAIRQNGTMWSWGLNSEGILGDGTTVNKCSPVSVVGGFTDWCQVSAGFRHNAAIRQNGTLWTWGYDTVGGETIILGNSTTGNKSSPTSVVGGFTDWCQTSAGQAHTLAVRQNGTLWAWGRNCSGSGSCLRGFLGDGTTVGKSSPVSVVGRFTDWCQVSAGTYITSAVRSCIL